MPDQNFEAMRARALETAEVELYDYGNERDWQKMRPDEMAELAITAFFEAMERRGWRPVWITERDRDG